MGHINTPNCTLSLHFIFIKLCNNLVPLKLSFNDMYFVFCRCFSTLSIFVPYLSSRLFGTAQPAVDQRNKLSAARCWQICANLYGRPLCLQSRNLIAVGSLELMSTHQIWVTKFQKVHKDFCFFCVVCLAVMSSYVGNYKILLFHVLIHSEDTYTYFHIYIYCMYVLSAWVIDLMHSWERKDLIMWWNK